MKNYLFILLLFVATRVMAQSKPADKTVLAGNEYYKSQQYAKAAEEYRKALEADPANKTAKFNKGNALYKQDMKVEASILFNELTTDDKNIPLRSKAFYNKGVILSNQKNLEESIEAYKNALRNDPADKEARENLQKALLELKKKNEEKKKEQDQPKKKQEQQPKKQQQPKMNPKEAEQRLKLLQQKEKEVQERVQKEKTKTGGSAVKDW
ncbi:MAG TPA: tetratricopeptide repeat protein [Chitinophagaceae bacterium]|nr:tetratricopeptide repeat protein [Chitinophagaceae bacterium]